MDSGAFLESQISGPTQIARQSDNHGTQPSVVGRLLNSAYFRSSAIQYLDHRPWSPVWLVFNNLVDVGKAPGSPRAAFHRTQLGLGDLDPIRRQIISQPSESYKIFSQESRGENRKIIYSP